MQFIIDGDYYKISRITGNHYNFLSIKFSKNPCEISISDIVKGNKGNLDKAKVLQSVIHGLNEINIELEQNYCISDIQFISTDSKPYSVYTFLTKEIVRRKNDIL